MPAKSITVTHAVNQSAMLLDAMLAQQAIQLLFAKEQETTRLLELAQDQNQALLLLSQQQQDMMAQQQSTIDRMEAELRAYRLAQQSAFSQVHAN